jgi:hypothetical protein
MATKLNHTALESAIYGGKELPDLIGPTHELLAEYAVSDYVGSYLLDTQRFSPGSAPPDAARFFEDQGAFVQAIPGQPLGQPFNLSLFATFLVVEIEPGSPEVEFLVLAPRPEEELQDAPYAGLMSSRNTDQLRDALADNAATGRLFEDIARLLEYLRSAPTAPAKAGWLSRLMPGKSTRKH